MRRSAVDLLAQLAHADVDRAVARAVGHVPDALLQLVAAHRPAAVLCEDVEQAELGRCEAGVGARAAVVHEERALLVGIDLEALDRDRARAQRHRRDLAAAERGVHARHQLAHAEGLGQVVVGADLERVHLVVLAAARRDHDDRGDDALGTCALGHRPAVEAGKHQIDDGDVGALEAELAESALTVLRPLDVETAMPEVRADRARDHPVVLDQQYRWHGSKVRAHLRP